MNDTFWRGRRVLVTGHTGFKGSWLCRLLAALGAEIHGLALDPPSSPSPPGGGRGWGEGGARSAGTGDHAPPNPSAFDIMRVAETLAADHRADIRDAAALARIVHDTRPDVVLHLAAQALVPRGHREPAATFATNLGGTINLLEALRGVPGIAAALIVTSDKVYRNHDAGRPFTESDPLGGDDPYSASKAAAELAVASWRASFPRDLPPLATARAGNVIGGGDFAADRIIPDLVRAGMAGTPLVVRRPDATRPFQHVLDVLLGYLLYARRLATGAVPASLNFGPRDGEVRVRDLLALWGPHADWRPAGHPVMEEARRLALDSTLAERALGWRPTMDTQAAIAATAAWYAAWREGADMARATDAAIARALGTEALAA